MLRIYLTRSKKQGWGYWPGGRVKRLIIDDGRMNTAYNRTGAYLPGCRVNKHLLTRSRVDSGELTR